MIPHFVPIVRARAFDGESAQASSGRASRHRRAPVGELHTSQLMCDACQMLNEMNAAGSLSVAWLWYCAAGRWSVGAGLREPPLLRFE